MEEERVIKAWDKWSTLNPSFCVIVVQRIHATVLDLVKDVCLSQNVHDQLKCRGLLFSSISLRN